MEKKSNFKKLALLGMAGGMLLSTTAVSANVVASSETYLAGGGCGGGNGKSGCGASRSQNARTYTADSDIHSTSTYPQQAQSYSSQPQSYSTQSQYNQQPQYPQQSQYNQQSNSPQAMNSNSQMNQSENLFLSQLNEQNKATFRGLDTEGRMQAMRLANQMKDKNTAVQQAAMQMADRQGGNNSMNGAQNYQYGQ
jgi:hypothetical protein